MDNMIQFRPAREADLGTLNEIFYQNEVLGIENPPALQAISSYPHILRTGKMVVAEQDGKILGYAGAITRDKITYLTDLFVQPDLQSGQIGKQLLQIAMPQDDLIHCTVSSTDLRALSLYVRAGMQPQWPFFVLRLEKPVRAALDLSPEIEIGEAHQADPELERWDARVSGRSRPADLEFLVQKQRGEPVWFRRGGQVVGYGYIRLDAGSLWYPHACMIGPLGVERAEDAPACVLAAVKRALQQVDVVRIAVPGPHPCLAVLLGKGFRITYIDTFVSAAKTPFFDAERYIPSGEDLF